MFAVIMTALYRVKQNTLKICDFNKNQPFTISRMLLSSQIHPCFVRVWVCVFFCLFLMSVWVYTCFLCLILILNVCVSLSVCVLVHLYFYSNSYEIQRAHMKLRHFHSKHELSIIIKTEKAHRLNMFIMQGWLRVCEIYRYHVYVPQIIIFI